VMSPTAVLETVLTPVIRSTPCARLEITGSDETPRTHDGEVFEGRLRSAESSDGSLVMPGGNPVLGISDGKSAQATPVRRTGCLPVAFSRFPLSLLTSYIIHRLRPGLDMTLEWPRIAEKRTLRVDRPATFGQCVLVLARAGR